MEPHAPIDLPQLGLTLVEEPPEESVNTWVSVAFSESLSLFDSHMWRKL